MIIDASNTRRADTPCAQTHLFIEAPPVIGGRRPARSGPLRLDTRRMRDVGSTF